MQTPIGELSSALRANDQAEHMLEVFAHPFTAGETIAQSKLGALRVNDQPARAEVVDQLGNGDYIVRITLARGARIHPSAVIGDPPEHRDHRWRSPGMQPEIADSATLEAFVTVDAGVHEPTVIGERTWLMKHVHVGHDARIGADCELAPGTVIGGHAVLEDGVRCGIGVLVRPFIRVGAGARLGAGAVVVKDVPAGEVWAGNPARRLEKRLATAATLTDAEEEGWQDLASRAGAQS